MSYKKSNENIYITQISDSQFSNKETEVYKNRKLSKDFPPVNNQHMGLPAHSEILDLQDHRRLLSGISTFILCIPHAQQVPNFRKMHFPN